MKNIVSVYLFHTMWYLSVKTHAYRCIDCDVLVGQGDVLSSWNNDNEEENMMLCNDSIKKKYIVYVILKSKKQADNLN